MKKVFIIFLLLFIFPNGLFAVNKNEVNYKIDDYIVDASIDMSGNLIIKEVIGVKGTFNGYIRDIVYKNNLKAFDGSVDSFRNKKCWSN